MAGRCAGQKILISFTDLITASLPSPGCGSSSRELETAAIITTVPDAIIAQIYTLMPAAIHPENFAQWLDVANLEADVAREMKRIG